MTIFFKKKGQIHSLSQRICATYQKVAKLLIRSENFLSFFVTFLKEEQGSFSKSHFSVT